MNDYYEKSREIVSCRTYTVGDTTITETTYRITMAMKESTKKRVVAETFMKMMEALQKKEE